MAHVQLVCIADAQEGIALTLKKKHNNIE